MYKNTMDSSNNQRGIIIVGPDLNKYRKYVVTIITNNIRAQGCVYVFEGKLYVICAAHILGNNNIYLNVLFRDVNQTGGDKILRFQTIGFERVSDVAVLLYYPSQNNGFLLDLIYYGGVQLVASPLNYNGSYYIINSISDLSDIEVQPVEIKNPSFYGDIEYLVPPSVLIEGNVLKGSSGCPCFDANGSLVGIASSNIRDTNMCQLVGTYVVDIINYIVRFNWRIVEPKLQNIYELGNYLKRSVRFGFMGANMKQYDIILANLNYYLTLENYRETLTDINLRRTGGILIADFIHGYNNIEKEYVYNPFQPIYTGFKIENPFKNSNMYKNFFTFNSGPVVLASIRYYDSVAHLQDYERTGVYKPATDFYVKNYLGKYRGQKSIFDFVYRVGATDNVLEFYFNKDPLTLPPLPFYIEYFYNDGKNWKFDTDVVLPFQVAYLDENNVETKQYSIEQPYPLYGAEVKMPGKDRYIPLVAEANILSTRLISGYII